MFILLEPIWSQHRKLLNKAFSPKNLQSFLHIYNTEGNTMIHKIQDCLDKKQNIDLLVLFRELTIRNGASKYLNDWILIKSVYKNNHLNLLKILLHHYYLYGFMYSYYY